MLHPFICNLMFDVYLRLFILCVVNLLSDRDEKWMLMSECCARLCEGWIYSTSQEEGAVLPQLIEPAEFLMAADLWRTETLIILRDVHLFCHAHHTFKETQNVSGFIHLLYQFI